jgi:penicillin V acylase-like amidase (Ntn superfamily)
MIAFHPQEIPMRTDSSYRGPLAVLVAAALVSASPGPTHACTRALYVAKDGTVIVGRSMDWGEDMVSNMWVLPRGMKRDGRGGKSMISWESKYGSLIVSAYDIGIEGTPLIGIEGRGIEGTPLFLCVAFPNRWCY